MEATKLHIKIPIDMAQSPGASVPAGSEDAGRLQFHAFLVVFHDWIRRSALPELMIDVADYSHVQNGPGVVLIGHAVDYYLDEQEGQPGLLFSRKRAAPPEGERLRDSVRQALTACRLLEQEPTLSPLKFRTDQMLLRIPDRLVVQNDAAGFASVRDEIQKLGALLYPGAKISLEQVGTALQPLSIVMRSSAGADLKVLLDRLA